jgi:hyperosmotically inducible protein
MFKPRIAAAAVIVCFGILAGCATQKSPSVVSATRKALDQAGLKEVSVTQDRDKGVVTLGGKVADEGAKSQAQSIAQGVAGGQVVANQIAVIPQNASSDTRTLYADLDKGIQSNLDAALIQNKIGGTVNHSTTNGVVTLSGTVDSEQARAEAQQLAAAVPNVQQVVNELQVKNQKATSTP